ncbi:carbohydrate kinase family protein [Glaciecola sp. 2405UD65-10]|jgi:fructokinase|uniref:carbohydrate kinase family protein n=1 Tax=Glaciecola sp. 2405UD65-10 TaxID=3397244 RepID=UPI003B5C33C0
MKVVCIGEMLIDMVCTDTNQGLVNGVNYLKKSGGAPANVAAAIGKLGGTAHLVAAVGNDPFGTFLVNEIAQYNVNTNYVSVLPMSTTLAFVSLADDGQREFAFNRGADEQLSLDAEALSFLSSDSILHIGSATALLGGPLNDTYLAITKAAHKNGNTICFDPNFRIGLWEGKEAEFIEACTPYFKMADIVKVSDEELELFTKTNDMEAGCQYFHDLGVKIVLVTLGGDGCLISQNGKSTRVPAYKIKAVDTTGAGDSFIGAVLYQLSQHPADNTFYANDMASFVAFAGKVSALVCSSLGAMSALPTLAEVEAITFEINQ